jgi:acyl-CoA synthetase (AMP-forming)/AMP-acid ligase II/thioesterase domain-containing protein/acyl carrier protein
VTLVAAELEDVQFKNVRWPMACADATVAAVIARHVALQPERPAIITSHGNPLTYGALGEQIAAFGERLRINSVRSSARVAIILPDGPELAVAIVAAACHAVAVPLNPNFTAPELDDLFAVLRIDAVVVSEQTDCPARDVAARRGVRLLEASCGKPGTFEIFGSSDARMCALDGKIAPSENVQLDSPAIILRTSATTGRPKLVPVTHRNLMSTADKRRVWFNFTPEDRAICVTPLYYGQALKGTLLTPLLLGGSVACPDRADGDILSWLAGLRPTWLDAVPAFHMNLLERALAQREVPLRHCLRFIRSGSAPLPVAVRQGLEEVFGVPVLEGYGLTETGTLAANSIAPERRKPGTVGRPSPQEVAIRAEGGRLLPPGSMGEIVVRGPAVMPGYLDNEEANRDAFADGWFLTGDLGSIDEDGYLTYFGRRKEFINRGGEKISLYEVDRALSLHPSIRDAAAFSVPHPRLGENVAAAVVLMPGAMTTPTEMKAFLTDHLAPFKIPHHVVVMPELPKGATGKTLRLQLSEAAAAQIRDIAPPEDPLHVQILEIWQRLLGRADIGIDEDFFEAGGDSLLAVQMVCEIEAITRQRIPPSALRSAYTVRELATAVVRGMPATPELVTLAKDGSGTPLLFYHGDYRTRGFYALKLADMLTGDQPVYLLHSHPNPDLNLTIEEMAQAYLPHVLTAHPAGAFQIGGYCHGGLLAWEIAHQLERMGREVEGVALVDTISLNAWPVFRAIAKFLGFVGSVAPKRIGEKLKADGMRTVWRTGKRLRAVWHTGKWHISGTSGSYSRAMSNYIPPKITTRVLCVICEESRTSAKFSTPWTNLAPDVYCDYVEGIHASCITKHVGDIARLFDDFFRATSARSTSKSGISVSKADISHL